jgi:hypothetical protein
MHGPHNVYLIWYGNWNGNSATTVLPDFIASLDGSSYFNTNTTYGDSTGNVQNTVTMAGQAFDNYSQGTALDNQGIVNVVANAINRGVLPVDTNGIYFVLTSADVEENEPTIQFCTQICGYHANATLFANDIKFAFVGNPDRCLTTNNSCLEFFPSPNNNSGADAMASVMAHELNEAVTDPDLNAWFHVSLGGEVGDLCSPFFVGFGPTFPVGNGASANIELGDRAYLIQSNFVNASGSAGGCQMSFISPSTPDFSLTATPTSRTVAQGSSTTYQVAVNRTGGFTDAVSFFVSAPPTSTLSGITASFSPSSTTGNSSTLTINASSTATLGSFSIQINGTSSTKKRVANAMLNIQAPADFQLAASPTLQAVTIGNNATFTVSISRSGGFSGAVALSGSGPNGMTVNFNPSSATGSSSTMTVTVSATAATGNFPITVTGQSGNLTHTTSVMLNIEPVCPGQTCAIMQTDGNFVVFGPGGNAIWSTGTSGQGAVIVRVQDDGNLVLYSEVWQAGTYVTPSPGPFPPQTCAIATLLHAPQDLTTGQCIVSPNNQYILYMAPDGNFYIYNNATGVATWGAGTFNHPGAHATLQTDGNFVVYDTSHHPLWNSGTWGTGVDLLNMESDGRIILYKPVWQSGTSQGWSTVNVIHPTCDMGPGTGWTGVIGAGQCFVSPDGRYELLLQASGTLVLQDNSVSPPVILWQRP